MDMFGMMNDMIGNMVRTLHDLFCIEGNAEDASSVPSLILLCCLGWTDHTCQGGRGCKLCFITGSQ